MLNRRTFLKIGTAVSTAIATPTLLIPQAKATIAPVSGLFRRRRLSPVDREVERLYSEKFATGINWANFVPFYVNRDERPPGFNCYISIGKDIHVDMCGTQFECRCKALGLDPETAKLQDMYPVFSVYNTADMSKATTPWGCRTTLEPLVNLRDALREAVIQKNELLANGWKLVHVANVA